jgi:crotonobetainyl-CoA:carnitine CoA-transferase CaiB-like acyl-CoA transferase
VAEWIAARPMNEVIAAFEKAEAAIAPVYDVEDILADPQMQALDTITTVHDEDLGPVRMQNVIARLSGTPGAIRFTGRALGADTDAILGALPGYDAVRIAELRAGKVVA